VAEILDWKISVMVSNIFDLLGSFNSWAIAKVLRSANYDAQNLDLSLDGGN
jgi:hypothetical protein